jgi:uncharacterized membrane protein
LGGRKLQDSIEPANKVLLQERFVTFDFLRGFAIFIMVLFHIFGHVYDHSWTNTGVLEEMPKSLLLVWIFFGFLLSLNSFFLFISSIVNSISITKKMIRGALVRNILVKQFLTGFILLLAGFLSDSLGYNGYFGQSLLTGNWRNVRPLWQLFFSINTLQIIGWCMIIVGFIQILLIMNEGYKKYIRNIAILLCLAIIVLTISPFLHNWVDNLPWKVPENPPPSYYDYDHTTWPSEYFQAENASFKAWILAIFAGDYLPFFPYLSTALFGTIIGFTLVRTKPVKKLPLIGGLSGLGIMGIGGIFLYFGFITFSAATRPALGNFLVITGAEVCIVMLFLWLLEYRGKAEKFASNIVVKHFRLWGMVSLTIYCLQIIEILPRWILGSFINLFTSIDPHLSFVFGYGKEYLAFLVGFFVILFFEGLVLLWSKFNFKYSFEWFIIKFQNLSSKSYSKRLDVDLIMNNVNWINFNQKLMKLNNYNQTNNFKH